MKLLVYIGTGLLITLAIFSFMRYLINPAQTPGQQTEIAAVVEIYRPPPRPTAEPEPEPEPEPLAEPNMAPLTVASPTPKPVAQIDQLMPSAELGDIAVTVGQVGDNWSAPVGATGQLKQLLEGGEDNQGYIEVTPYSTGQPNIPEIAWQNKLNGWVLVAFVVTPDGHTKNIRVLDANPKGIFEDNVVKAVARWLYSIEGAKNYQGDLVLTQKIELFWKDYPNNLPSL